MSRQDTITPSDFATLLADVKGRIQTAQTRAVLSANAELVRLYWDIGRLIAFPRAYPQPTEFLPQAVAKLISPPKVPQPAAQLPDFRKVQQPVALLAADSLLWQVPWFHKAAIKTANPTKRKGGRK